MNKIFALIIFIEITTGLYLFLSPNHQSLLTNQSTNIPTSYISISTSTEHYPVTASFEIYTNGLKRDFSASMYHGLSGSAYIEDKEPYNIVVTEPTTWQEFFNTLPFKLTKDCLTIGTGETFCSNDKRGLKFYLNDTEEGKLLELPIKDGDKVVIRYE